MIKFWNFQMLRIISGVPHLISCLNLHVISLKSIIGVAIRATLIIGEAQVVRVLSKIVFAAVIPRYIVRRIQGIRRVFRESLRSNVSSFCGAESTASCTTRRGRFALAGNRGGIAGRVKMGRIRRGTDAIHQSGSVESTLIRCRIRCKRRVGRGRGLVEQRHRCRGLDLFAHFSENNETNAICRRGVLLILNSRFYNTRCPIQKHVSLKLDTRR